MMFEIDPCLAADTVPVGAFPLSRVLLMNDARFPWLILVPARAGLREIIDLAPADRTRLMDEVASASAALAGLGGTEKINIGALGNIVAQLHVHVVARRAGDAAWPGPVWGAGRAEPYDADTLARLVAALGKALPGPDPAKWGGIGAG